MATSSTIFARCGSRTEISAPDCPHFAKWCGEPSSLGTALDEGEALALDQVFGAGLAVEFRELGLVIEQIELRGRRPP